MQLPRVFYPGGSKSISARNTFRRKLTRRRILGEVHGQYQIYLYFAEHEEDFLKILASATGQNWGWKTECGVLEIGAMLQDLTNLLVAHELREDIRVYERLKRWVLQNPAAQYRPYGTRRPRKHRMVLKRWELETKTVIRESQIKSQQDAFMRKWRITLGNNEKNVVMFRHPRGRSLKRRAKRKRKLRFGTEFLKIQDT